LADGVLIKVDYVEPARDLIELARSQVSARGYRPGH
jgi:hypothetical protein